MAENQRHHWWFSARRENLSRVIESLALVPDSTILEIGCGSGGNLPMLSKFGTVSAVECDEFSMRYAMASCAMEIRPGSLPDNIPYQTEFDLVCLFDVLEHVERDQDALTTVRSMVRRNGSVLVTVPAYSWLYGKHDELHGHYRRYSAAALANIAEKAGFGVVRVGYFNTLLFPLVVIRRLLSTLVGGVERDTEMPPAWINRALRAVFAAEGTWMTRRFFPFGTSVIAVLRREN